MSSSSVVRLVGLDFGSTTTSGVVARATLHSGPDRRSELADVAIDYRSSPVFTPFHGEQIDESGLARWLDEWSQAAEVSGQGITAGGAIVTGLAARASNAQVVRQLVQARFGQTMIATADDPALESWLAFMANCRDLSLANPAAPFLNFDIGGGTTNIALGVTGDVKAVGCYQLGARHIRVEPGSYQIVGFSHAGRRLLGDLGIVKREGDILEQTDVARIVDFVVVVLEAAVTGRMAEALVRSADYLIEQPFEQVVESPVVTFSGGVGELVYQAAMGHQLPATTVYGDLGIDLARRICRSPLLSHNLVSHTPHALGRATVLGLAIHHVELSGATIYLPNPAVLPLAELPIVGRLSQDSGMHEILAAIGLAKHTHAGGCIAIELADARYESVSSFGGRLASALAASCLPADRPLVMLVNQNVGKALGHYATRWERLPVTLIVLDELPDRGATFLTLGKMHDQLVPVSFYGVGRCDRFGAAGGPPCSIPSRNCRL